jgi:hypothetical protein
MKDVTQESGAPPQDGGGLSYHPLISGDKAEN